jgi:hypothetical protein
MKHATLQQVQAHQVTQMLVVVVGEVLLKRYFGVVLAHAQEKCEYWDPDQIVERKEEVLTHDECDHVGLHLEEQTE